MSVHTGLTCPSRWGTSNSDPNDSDSDNDWIRDNFETEFLGANPKDADSDGDGMADFWEGINWIGPIIHNPNGDPDGDGYQDLMMHFLITATGIACGDVEATLTGETLLGQQFTGTDVIKIVGKTCK
jgi:hypothetical protein